MGAVCPTLFGRRRRVPELKARTARFASSERARELACEQMLGARDLDPPLTFDAGIGPNWVEAK